jgi:hypothetical protein
MGEDQTTIENHCQNVTAYRRPTLFEILWVERLVTTPSMQPMESLSPSLGLEE